MKNSLILALVLLPVLAFSQIPKSYLCVYTKNAPQIDGKLSDAAWQQAPWTDSFVDIEGDKKPLPRFKTHVKMLWDDSCFYIGAELQELDVWATIAKRDDVIFHDNDFEVFMDPNGDNFEYGEFEINALNTGWDLFLPKPYKDNGSAVDSWNIAGIRTAIFVNGTLNNPADTDSGWSVEIAMPWKSLEKCSHSANAPQDNSQWRINFSRVEWLSEVKGGKTVKIPNKPEDNWVWSPQGVINMHRPEMWGFVQFSKGDSTTAILPDSLGTARRVLHEVYYAEKEYFSTHSKWTSHLSELNLPPDVHVYTQLDGQSFTGEHMIGLNDSGFVATLRILRTREQQKRDIESSNPLYDIQAHIRQDSYYWIDGTKKR